MYAAHGGHFQTCVQLLQYGATVDVYGDGKKTPLILASACGNVDVVCF